MWMLFYKIKESNPHCEVDQDLYPGYCELNFFSPFLDCIICIQLSNLAIKVVKCALEHCVKSFERF